MLYNIKSIRVKLGMSQEELAQKSGITRATISKLESGEEAEVKIGTLKAIALALRCEVSDLICVLSSILDKTLLLYSIYNKSRRLSLDNLLLNNPERGRRRG